MDLISELPVKTCMTLMDCFPLGKKTGDITSISEFFAGTGAVP